MKAFGWSSLSRKLEDDRINKCLFLHILRLFVAALSPTSKAPRSAEEGLMRDGGAINDEEGDLLIDPLDDRYQGHLLS